MKEILIWVNIMDKENFSGPIIVCMMVNGNKIKNKAMVNTNGETKEIIKVNLLMIFIKEKEFLLGKMGMHTQDSGI